MVAAYPAYLAKRAFEVPIPSCRWVGVGSLAIKGQAVGKSSWTIKDLIVSIKANGTGFPEWPPDLFAIVATILAETGGYVYATRLAALDDQGSWQKSCKEAGTQWSSQGPPKLARDFWRELCEQKVSRCELGEVASKESICLLLVKLLGIADEASAGFGIDWSESTQRKALRTLAKNSNRSLTSENINLDRARVLPKQHTPRNGLTLRSLSHHLALVRPRGVVARWGSPLGSQYHPHDNEIVNILLCPWPIEVTELDFVVSPIVPDHVVHHSSPYRFFSFDPGGVDEDGSLMKFENELRGYAEKAVKKCGSIHVIIFPELSLSDAQLGKARKVAVEFGAVLIAGVRHKDESSNVVSAKRNSCFVESTGFLVRNLSPEVRTSALETLRSLGSFQDKHHRWSLDWRQIRQYGLGGILPSSKQCWEWTPIRERRLHFWTVCSWLTWTPLICEDLARQDPVADILRSVGPNLVIALLMDGPQLLARWSAQFASVLAEDPGSSVLTLTCLGMTARSVGPKGEFGSRVIALWRDHLGGPKELALPRGHDAAVISVSPVRRREWSADGRCDGGVSSTPVLAGFTPLRSRA